MRSLIKISNLIVRICPYSVALIVSRGLALFYVFSRPCYRKSLLNIISTAFPQKSSAEIQRIAIKSQQRYFEFFVTYQHLAQCSTSKVKASLEKISIEGFDYIEDFKNKEVPILIVSLHIGDFMMAFLKLISSLAFQKKVALIKWMQSSTKEVLAYQKFQDLGFPLTIFRLREKPGLEALRFLKQNNVLFTMSDINPDLLKTQRIHFFDKAAYFPVGPAELALAANATIVPIYSVFKAGKPLLKISKPICPESIDTFNLDFTEKVQLLTQAIAEDAEACLKVHPEDWHFWPLMNAMWEKSHD